MHKRADIPCRQGWASKERSLAIVIVILIAMSLPAHSQLPLPGGGDSCRQVYSTYTDNFNRADGSLGASWVNVPGADCAPAIASDLVIASVPACGHALAYYDGGFANNQFSRVVFGSTPAVSPLSTPTLTLHGTNGHIYNDAYDGGYALGIYPGGMDFCGITPNAQPAAGDTVELDSAGTNPIFFWSRLNGTINAGCVDTTYLYSGGAPGIGVIEQNATRIAKSGTWTGGSLPDFNSTFSDSFNRDNAGWLGVDWWFPFANTDEGGGWVVNSNTATLLGNWKWSLAIWTTSLTGNHSSTVTIGNLTSGDWIGAITRYTPTSSADNGYLALNNSGNLFIFVRYQGSWNQLASTSYTASPGDVLEFDATGVSPVVLTVKVNGLAKLTFTDSTYHLAGNYAGFAGLGTNTTTVTHWAGGNI